jgi:hypothetical protein
MLEDRGRPTPQSESSRRVLNVIADAGAKAAAILGA